MYSPKISEELISPLYHQAKQLGITMTRLVNEILSEHLSLEDQPNKCAEDEMEVYSTNYDNQNKGAS